MRVHSHRNVLLVELMIGILFFLLSFSVLLEVFTAAYRQSMESERISRAMLEAQDLADCSARLGLRIQADSGSSNRMK